LNFVFFPKLSLRHASIDQLKVQVAPSKRLIMNARKCLLSFFQEDHWSKCRRNLANNVWKATREGRQLKGGFDFLKWRISISEGKSEW